MLMAVCHSEATGWTEVDDLARLSDLRGESENLLWAEGNVAHMTPDDVAVIAEEFALHPLAVEDAINARQRPKFEPYETHLFLVFHQLDEVRDHLEARQVACFVGERYVLTLHAGAERTLEEARRRWDARHRFPNHPSYLLHALLDVVVDDYQSKADALEDRVEELEEIALENPNAPLQRQLYSLKQQLSRLRRYALPTRRILDRAVQANGQEPFSPETADVFRDVHDHILRIAEQVGNVEDLTNALLDLRRSEQANALNDVTKRLTGWAAVIAVPTWIASVYGMNFELIPEEQSIAGFFFAIALMAVTAAGLYAFFRRRGWI